MFTLTVLETCVKNCTKRFHVLVTNKDFVQELVKLIGPKNDPPATVQEKVLSLIQSWAEAFHGQPELQGVSAVYNELRSKGIEFPKSAVEAKVPIHTPQRSISTKSPEAAPSATPTTNSQPRSMSPPQRPPTATMSRPATSEIYPIHLSPEQLNKLKNELEVVQGNMKVLSEMLTEMKPGLEHKDDWELLLELHGTCQSMQKRIVELIEKVANEEVTNELLRINDELNNLFMRFERYQKKRGTTSGNSQDITMIASTSAEPKPVAASSRAANASDNVPSLIDFTDDEPDGITTGISSLQVSQPRASSTKAGENIGDQEFDMFAQQRSGPTSGPSPSGNNSQDLLALDPVAAASSSSARPREPSDDKEMREIEGWLSNEQPSSANAPPASNGQFEQFLQRRANALEQQPMKKNAFNQDSSLI